MKLQVTNSPFNEEQAELLNRVLPTLTEVQRIWLAGYVTALSGESAAVLPQEPGPAAPAAASWQTMGSAGAESAPAVKEVTVLFGSQTGNSQRLAQKLAGKLQSAGAVVTLSSMSDFKANTLKKVQNLFIVVSTQGEGDPPDNAISFYEFLHGKRAPQLPELNYSVLALGDTSYEFFCKTGKDFDKRLEELGARRLVPRVDCDVEFDEPAAGWINEVANVLNETAAPSSPEGAGALNSDAGSAGALSAGAVNAGALSIGAASAAAVNAVETESVYSRKNPFNAEVLENLNLNGRGSARETRHLEISLEGSNLRYEPGDSLGIYPSNEPTLVDELIAAFGWNPDEEVPFGNSGQAGKLRDALIHYYEITVLSKQLLGKIADLAPDSGVQALLSAERDELRSYLSEHDLLDLANEYAAIKGIAARDFVAVLRKIPPRLYSIASSQAASPDEVHLTVRAVRYETGGRLRKGVCSVQLAERVQPGDLLPVFVQKNPNFKLPASPDTPIIMIGPGTGVAPFRSFLSEREETGAAGKTWLFYGDQHFSTDFLYQIEWQRWLKDGVLTKMDVAFSRDTERKVYVQHRMLENSAQLYQWLQEGASVYVCGDKQQMAADVHSALQTILVREGGMSEEEAAAYLADLQKQKRYQRDVY